MAKIRRHPRSRRPTEGRAAKRLEQEIARRRAAEVAREEYRKISLRWQGECRQWKEKVRQVSHQLLTAQEEERKKLSRELHDVLAQALAGINARLDALKADAAINRGNLTEGISSTQHLVEKSIDIVHRFARGLRPTELDDLGLIRALHAYLTGLRRKTGMPLTLTASAAVESIGVVAQTVLYHVAQEALTNVVRHAQASRAEVKIQKLRRHVVLKVRDDGCGFPPARLSLARRDGRLGLLGMRERVELIGGNLSIKSTPGKGTIILIKVPLQAGGTRPR